MLSIRTNGTSAPAGTENVRHTSIFVNLHP